MEKKFKLIICIAIVAVVSITAFQTYWIWENYLTNQRNFRQTVSNALQKSVNLYLLKKIELPASLQSNKPYISVMKSISDTAGNVRTKNVESRTTNKKFGIKFEQVKITPENLGEVTLFLARLNGKTDIKSGDLSWIRNIFKQELLKEKVPLNFKLWLANSTDSLSGNFIVAKFGDRKQKFLAAEFYEDQRFLLYKMFLPGVVSVSLVLLSAASLYLMAQSVKKQIRFNNQKNEFISNVSHELRTPVSILRSTNEALLNFGEINNREKALRYLRISADILLQFEANIDRLFSVANNLEHPLSTIEEIKIDSLMEKFMARFEQHATIEYVSFLSSATINSDPYALESILSNLIDNAIKYNINWAEVIITINENSTHWQISVKDNGIGISKANQALIFDRFYRVPTGELHIVKGYGLGLSYAKQLVEIMRGAIIVESDIGKGSNFILRLPKHE